MKKFYDKLLLLLAALALLGGVAFYVLKSDNGDTGGTSGSAPPAGAPYEAIPIPKSTAITAEWPPAEPQSSGEEWLYDVFTPPKIYIDAEGNFTAIPPTGPVLPQPFGIYLEEISQKPYRIQIQGFSGDRSKPKECVLFFFDEERQVRFFIRPGQTNDEAEVEVLDFTIDREIDDNNVVNVTVIATIMDKRSGETVKLVDGERLLESEISIIIRSKQDPEVLVQPTQVGDTFETPSGKYVLKEINLEDGSVTVEKQATDEFDAETRTLFAESKQEPDPVQPEKDTTETPTDFGAFDSVFE